MKVMLVLRAGEAGQNVGASFGRYYSWRGEGQVKGDAKIVPRFPGALDELGAGQLPPDAEQKFQAE
jgi:hypothetical protein